MYFQLAENALALCMSLLLVIGNAFFGLVRDVMRDELDVQSAE